MIVFDITGTENHASYQSLEIQNLGRQYDFLRSAFIAANNLGFKGLGGNLLKSLNGHAIACLHSHAGIYRPEGVEVYISDSEHKPPHSALVNGLMEQFILEVNKNWDHIDPVALSAYVLWRLNWIHPFVNGNGRTARAAAYYVICRRLNGWLPGVRILPELIRETRGEYVSALRHADATFAAGSRADLSTLHSYLARLLMEQLKAHASDQVGQPSTL